jgi:mycothiol synthase
MSQDIQLPSTPALPGLRFRHFNDETDFAAMVAVIEGCQEHDQVDPLSPEAGIPSVQELSESFSQAQNIDLNKDLLLVELDGAVIGFQWLRWWSQADGTWIYYHRGRILPQWRGQGIGTATLRWAEERIRELAEVHPTRGRAVFRANTTSHEKEYNELLLTEGYAPIHSFIELGYDAHEALPDVHIPSGFVVKPAKPEHYRAIWEANEEAFADEWGRREATELDYVRFLGNPNFDPTLWQVAWHEDEIAGVALCEINERGVGEITDLSVRKAFRGQGLARALIVHAVRTLIERQPKHVRIFTDLDDPFGARKLYESVGFRVLTEYIRYQKPIQW